VHGFVDAHRRPTGVPMFGWIHISLPITDPKLPGAIIYLCPELAVCMNNGIIPGRN